MKGIGFRRWEEALEALFKATVENEAAAIDIYEEGAYDTDISYVGCLNWDHDVVVTEIGELYERLLPAGSIARLYELWLIGHEEGDEDYEMFYDLYQGDAEVKAFLAKKYDLGTILGVD